MHANTQPFGKGGGWESFLSWPSRGSCHSWTCCLGSSAACCWTDCADQDHPTGKTHRLSQFTFRPSKDLYSSYFQSSEALMGKFHLKELFQENFGDSTLPSQPATTFHELWFHFYSRNLFHRPYYIFYTCIFWSFSATLCLFWGFFCFFSYNCFCIHLLCNQL